MKRYRTLAASAFAWASAIPAAALAQDGGLSTEASGSGVDLLDISRRIDLRVEVSETDEVKEYVYTLRHDYKIKFDDGWQLTLRADLPFKDVPDPSGEYDLGAGDMLLHVGVVRRLAGEQGFGVGAQVIAPTAKDDAHGRGKWRMRPIVGYRWPVKAITPGSFFQLQARYDFSFAGDDSRRETRELQVSPNLEIALPESFYVSIFPSTDFRYDFTRDELFVPADIEVGKEWGRMVWSLEAAAGIIKEDHPLYDWKVETRLGWRF